MLNPAGITGRVCVCGVCVCLVLCGVCVGRVPSPEVLCSILLGSRVVCVCVVWCGVVWCVCWGSAVLNPAGISGGTCGGWRVAEWRHHSPMLVQGLGLPGQCVLAVTRTARPGGQAAWEEAQATPISSEGGEGALAHSPLRVGPPWEPVPTGGSQQRLYSAQPMGSFSVWGLGS